MNNEPTTAEKIQKLPWSMGSNAALTVFVQLTFFGSVFVLFLDALDLDKTQIGFLLSLIPFSNAIALFIVPAVTRFGYKRTYVTFFGARTAITAFLLLTPWVFASFGSELTLIFITVIVALFAITRSIGVTAAFPWIQEYVPNSVRGKYSATNNIFMTITGFITITGAGFVLERVTGLNGFMILIGIGLVFGFISIWAASKIPGGLPVQAGNAAQSLLRDFLAAIKDRDWLLFLFGAGCMTMTIASLNSFVPLFMTEQVKLSSGNVVLIQTGVLLGGLLSTYVWGWLADRYGSRPITLSGASIRIVLPLLWMLMPRNNAISLYVAVGIAVVQGVADMGWTIGSARLLYVSVVPPEKKSEYMALFSTWVGLASGVGQLAAGQIVQLSGGLSSEFFIFTVDPYTGLFIIGLILPVVSILVLSRVSRADSRVSVEEFAGLFLRGNALAAMTSLLEFHLLAKDEAAVVHSTERLGRTRSPLTVDELMEALTDPRFNVRFEAIISIARTRQDPQLTEALIQILNGTELSLSVIAAWALGRIGDPAARDALRAGLDSNYRSIRAHCIRALGTMGDTEVGPKILERMDSETDKGLRMAYASALGKLGLTEATGQMLHFLHEMQNEGARQELALAVARLVGGENHFIHLVRASRSDMGTVTAQAAVALKKKVGKEQVELVECIDACADSLARENIEQGAEQLYNMIQLLPPAKFDDTSITILQECAARLAEYKDARSEYLLLALHVAEVGWQA